MVIHKNYPKSFVILRWKLDKILHRFLAYATLLKKIFLVTLLSNKSKKQTLQINTFDKYVYIYVYAVHTHNLVKINWWQKMFFYHSLILFIFSIGIDGNWFAKA